MDGRHRAAEEASRLGLPVGVHDHRFAFANGVVIPSPDLRLDRFANGGHVLKLELVLTRLVRSGLPEHPDRCRRRMKYIDPQSLGDPPRPPGVRIGRYPLIHYGSGRQRKRPVHDVRMARNPSDISHAPIHIFGVDILHIFRGARHICKVTARIVLTAFRLPRRTAGVHQEERRFGRHGYGFDSGAKIVRKQLVHEEVPALYHL